ncbi:hypothetical protein A2415_04885 [candidate division WWE3 bacterium RIFOXYC1_FULL_39_7]|uniref:Class I SAM-dependent methyltransferase n=2 Tax=Katanobacteria TaxID=422282 RepID=A0A1F4X6V2_UNCKA|nr:MAG: hypothetical protein A2415_04885 [candidate division WWE3 bacterium RIFOXYC1_FULL_39_7]OGC77397.1 MAG: hypothetical protein A2619_03215 [candidate division WWE3 bacterium RIFOXYD1_FULL_39_9]
MRNRIDLAKYFKELGFKRGAEIGVSFGYYSEVLCKNIPGLKLISVDSWNSAGNRAREFKLNLSAEAETRRKLASYEVLVIKGDSLEVAEQVQDESLDFVFIDAGHGYTSVKSDIEAWSKKVKNGGIVSGHDYYVFLHSGNRGVIDAVNEYVKKHNYHLQVIDWDRDNPVRDDRPPCWYFVKT